jgi:MoaA/NifB/PqqE/SkfB family radical SAM enzyme
MRRHERNLLEHLRVLTFFVTSKCNARCRTCFYWQELNKDVESMLSLAEIERISASMPAFPHLLVSGGEPLLRSDLEQVLDVFVRHNRLVSIDIPTNGLLAEPCVAVAESVLTHHPQVLLTIGVSLDGLEATHDSIRGVPGNFQQTFRTLEQLNALRTRQSMRLAGSRQLKFQIYTLTVLTQQNIGEVPQLIEYVKHDGDVDGMMFEIIRGTPLDSTLHPPAVSDVEAIVPLILETNFTLMGKRWAPERAVRLSYIKSVYQLQTDMLRRGRLAVPCQAGVALGVVEPNGDVRLCELLEPVGNLRDAHYDFKAVWLGQAAQEQRAWIRRTQCACTHCVNIGHSVDASASARRRRMSFQHAFERKALTVHRHS